MVSTFLLCKQAALGDGGYQVAMIRASPGALAWYHAHAPRRSARLVNLPLHGASRLGVGWPSPAALRGAHSRARQRTPPVAVLGSVKKWLRVEDDRASIGERIAAMVLGANAAPVAQYVSSPVTALHLLDARVKQAWLFALVLLPSSSSLIVRSSLVGFLVLATMWALPRQMWQDQLRRMLLLSSLVMVMVMLGTEGAPASVQARRLPPAMEGIPNLPGALSGYSYLLLKIGPVQLTRRGLSLASSAAFLSFTVLQSATLCLTTTTPEQLAAALRWYMKPLSKIRVPVDEIIFTLLLSLRFVGLVFDEVQNVALALVSRGMQSHSMKAMDTVDGLFTVCGRLFKNLFIHVEQISEAMVARGYRGVAADHEVYSFREFRMTAVDIGASVALLFLLGTVLIMEVSV